MRTSFAHLSVKVCLAGFLFNPTQLLAQQWQTSGNNLYTATNVKVGIGLTGPARSLESFQLGENYIRVTSYGGASLSSHAAGLELRRSLGATSNIWSINNEDHFRIRHNGDLMFAMSPDMARLGINLDNPVEFTIYGKNVTKSGNSVVDGALRLHSRVGGNIHMLALDGNQMESSDPLYLNNESDKDILLANGGGRVKVGTTDNEARFSVASESDMQLKLINPGGSGAAWRIGVANSNWGAGAGKLVFSKTANSSDATMVITPAGNVGIGLTTPSKTLHVNGTTSTKILEITGGADFAEHFDIEADETLVPGTVVSIDPNKPGQLRVARQAYDKTVAGIVSGAGDVQPGMLMGQAGTLASGQHPVALTGRVYCRVDAQYGAIRPGDLLTTSPTAGHAMKASDGGRAQGAILGKAMTSLETGTGLVLVLVSLQ
ncbi:hypothetical protein [Spirosoma montaniterrae]|uniref:DUF5666 domain-containing protein n=1 Tax=Spirosoma montaniterrae TaxID=1178516 RepID=A0A1P9WRM0_9BACT|nr:hypothetical protein [Spirosoma montaniterrae]AQG78027.1 hypothetical protein AWR27_00875 [Spirosoma montaniterrae]